MTISLFGSIFMIAGAWNTYKGNIFVSLLSYIVADISWVILTYQNNDYIGTSAMIIGLVLGILASRKMLIGEFHKKVVKE